MEFDRPSESRVTLELTPLIDVIFQLLVFFMLSSTFMYPAVELKLPELSREPDPAPQQRLVISINKEGQYFINTKPINHDDLLSEIRKHLETSQDKSQSIFIRVDSQIAYGKFMELMDVARKAGVVNYHLLYEPKP
jgi:biopolymer transport protein ExbD